MATATMSNGNLNGAGASSIASTSRFSDVPLAVDIPVSGEMDEAVEVNLEDQLDDPTELCQLLENEKAAKNLWITISLAYAKQGQFDHALEILEKGSASLARTAPKDRLPLLGCMAWLDLLKSRQAPRVASESQIGQDIKTKDHFLREATAHINDAQRINPAFSPLLLTRGVLSLLKASLTSSTKTGHAAETERAELLREALKCFDEALRISGGRNIMAAMGRARTLYLLKQYTAALTMYQTVMSRMPKFTDPDPRIGIGCCFWQLGYPENAKDAWERSLVLNPESKVAHALMGVYYLYEARKYPVGDPQFNALYGKAVKLHMQKAHTLDKKFAFNCANFASYFLYTNRYAHLEALARMGIEQTDVNAIASDGWYLIARKEHNSGDFQKANDAYNKADQARGGNERGYWPAKFGMIQLSIQSGNLEDARFRLEKVAQSSKCIEATTLLAAIYVEGVFAAQRSLSKEDKTNDQRKAITLLENVRRAWKDPKLNTKKDATVLVYLSRLYEKDNPDESAKCLAELTNLELENADTSELPKTETGTFDEKDAGFVPKLADLLPPQLLNNTACFYYGIGSYDAYESAKIHYESALNAVVALNEKQEEEKRAVDEADGNVDDLELNDTDALRTSITYNLGRTHEALGNLDEAKLMYERLLQLHPDYSEAAARLAVIALQESPQDQGPRKIAAVYQTDYGNTEVRALMGWYYHSSKKRTMNIAEDVENRHYKHTLQGYDKHDLYSLTGMGNVHLMIARDMPRNTDAEKEKRSKMYQKAYEFFDKALQLDPKNAYAAQGVAIALCDDKKNYSEALQILTKAKDTIKDASVHVNLGHVYAELRQFQRSIDNYEMALRKSGEKSSGNAQLYACLSRVWLLKGKADKSIYGLNTALDYMRQALSTQPESAAIQFNVAFIQFQIVQMVNSTQEINRTLEDVGAAQKGLEEAIATFESVAKSKNPPYPRSALEQRAAMSKGTMRKQIERSHQQQAEYERNNAEKIAQAKEKRAEDIRRREEAAALAREAEVEKQRRMDAEREKMIRQTEEMAEKQRAEALAREAAEYTDDEETGERVKRASKKKQRTGGGRSGKKRDRDDDGFIEDDENEGASERSVSRTPLSGGSDDEAIGDSGRKSREKSRDEPKKKRRKLERKSGAAISSKAKEKPGKFKSAAVVVDSDSDEEPPAVATPDGNSPDIDADGDGDVNMGGSDGDDGEEEEERIRPARPRTQRKQLRTIADDDDDEDEEEEEGGNDEAPRSGAARVVSDDEDGDE